jgi:membrane-bound lytic murein transglycosylase D
MPPSRPIHAILIRRAVSCFLAAACVFCAAAHAAPVVSLTSDSAAAAPGREHAGRDTLVDAGRFIDEYGLEPDSVPAGPDIEYLLESATIACKADSFGEADVLLKKALSLIRRKADDDRSFADTESYSRSAAAVYADNLPEAYADSVPDEISMLVFQKKLSRSLDTLKLSRSDSAILNKLSCRKATSGNFPIVWNDRVYRSLCFFARNAKGLDKRLVRAAYYQPFMQRMFADSGLPTDLSYLPFVESGFDPNACSRRNACGIWQFIPETGTRYGLRNNYWLDERRDPVLSTGAAIRYLKKLFGQFGDWTLALAAYNCGENGVADALAKSSSASYWRLSLPRETKNYVPEFISALMVAKNPECFGYEQKGRDAFDLDAMLIDECLNMQAIADSLGIDGKRLRDMNPHFLHWCTPPSVPGARLYLPKGTGPRFTRLMQRRPDAFRVTWYEYRAGREETLASVSRAFKVPLEAVVSINEALPGGRIETGKSVFVPIPIRMSTAQAYEIARDLARDRPADKPERSGTIRYQVRPGETIRDLAEAFDIRENDICTWNSIPDRRLRAGQYLTLRLGPRAAPLYAADDTVPAGKAPFATYPVRRGETLFSIARMLSVSVNDLISWNRLSPQNPVIFSGQNLLYKPGHRTMARFHEPDTLFYRVCKGETLVSLASSFSVSVASLRRANNLSPSSVLKAGELIKIPYVKKPSGAGSRPNRAPIAAQEEQL